MTRRTKALSGASQDAYFRRVLKTHPGISDDARERIVRRLRKEVSLLRVRTAAEPETGAVPAGADAEAAPPIVSPAPDAVPAEPFDPFVVNVVVVLRTAGREAALAALTQIGDCENLRRLAREQQLGVGTELASTAELSAAIVAAAERRIANRRAAAGSR